jgi:steroid 5-alpha reductase family enzyme
MTAASLLGLATLVALGIMVLLWLLHLRLRDAGVVDVGWAGILGLLAVLHAALGPGWETRRLLAGAMGGLWGLRLAAHVFLRLKGKPEEGRYQALRAKWGRAGANVPLRFLGFFLLQGLLDVFLSVPFLAAAMNPAPRLSPLEAAGLALWAVSLAGESLADAQLARFKANPANAGKTCRQGLWSASRHPNYFFEWLVWCAYAVFALASPWGFVALVCPALMLYFLLRVTGIPATEAQALRSRGEDYRDYQRTTSAFVPWFRKKPAS